MNFYICVYLQKDPKPKEWKRAWGNAKGDEALEEYLTSYENRFEEDIGPFYDWGDDPAFFASKEFGGNVTWGVCRGDVRWKLKEGDIVVFFCAQEQENQKSKKWKYYYVGLGTVGDVVEPREQLWKKSRYQKYRNYYNLLINKNGCHREPIDYHDDWAKRLAARYIIFDKDPAKTHFNVTNPLHVATYRKGAEAWKREILERWRLSDERVHKVYKLVEKRDGWVKLRTTNKFYPHKEMNLATLKHVKLDDKQLEKKRRGFLQISKEVAKDEG